jgi:serine/threonine protein kinase
MSDLPLRLGNYELVRLLAQGGMADIYLARQAGLDRMVAVKVNRATDPESVAMFRDEARLVGMLSHANLAAVHEVASDQGVTYLAMEYVAGADLREVLAAAQKQRVQIPYATAVAIVMAAAAGLDHAHRRCGPDGRPLHLVHRDVSLSNIMVSHDGAVKVIDFGIACSQVSSHQTSPGIVRGKASYMSPEQCVGDAVDRRTDVFALGVVLYELTTGRRCFEGASDFERMLAVVQGNWTPPTELDPHYPLALERVIRTALAPDPCDRFASCAAMIEALERVCDLEGWCPGGVAALMATVFPQPAAIADGEPTVRVRRLARGTDSDMYEDDAPTRGRRSLSRLWSPLAA